MPYIGKAPSSGIRSRFIYTATSGQTTFTGSDSNGKTLGYTDSEYVDVYLNGVLLEPSDYTATSKTSVVLDSGATVGDTMEIVVYDTFSVFNGTFSGDITVGGGATIDGLLIKDKEIGTSAAPATLQASAINNGQIGGRRNLVYNGAMKISQRGTQTGQTDNSYTACDRFLIAESGATVTTTTQETDVPSGQGFANSLEIDVTTADASVAASDTCLIIQRLEGQDLQHLLYGTSSAKDLTVSFWVKSPKTGTHILELRHNDATYFNSQAYTITSANTWQKVTKTFSGYTTTAFDDDTNHSLSVNWWLMAGSDKSGGTLSSNTWHNTPANRAVGQVNCVDDTANNFYLTGVQVEVGSVATEFEHLTFGEELALCQRYYKRLGAPRFNTSNYGYITGASVNANAGQGMIHHHPEMRANPTVEHTGTASDYKIKSQNSNKTCSAVPQFTNNSRQTTTLWFTASGLLTSGFAVHLMNATTDGFVAFEAEL